MRYVFSLFVALFLSSVHAQAQPTWVVDDLNLGTIGELQKDWTYDLRSLVTNPGAQFLTFSAKNLPTWMMIEPVGILSVAPGATITPGIFGPIELLIAGDNPTLTDSMTAHGVVSTPLIIDPMFEGVYKIMYKCRDLDNKRCVWIAGTKQYEGLTTGEARLTIITSTYTPGVYISVSNAVGFEPFYFTPVKDKNMGFLYPTLPMYLHNITSYQNRGATLVGNSVGMTPKGTGSEIQIEINPTDRTINSFLRDIEFDADFNLSGKQISSTEPIYKSAEGLPPMQDAQLDGAYEAYRSCGGKELYRKGDLFIRRSITPSAPKWYASYVNEWNSREDFDRVEVYPALRAAGLFDLLDGLGKYYKLTVALSCDEKNHPILRGISHSMEAGQTCQWLFKRKCKDPNDCLKICAK